MNRISPQFSKMLNYFIESQCSVVILSFTHFLFCDRTYVIRKATYKIKQSKVENIGQMIAEEKYQ